jgi:hypothetical protein
MSFLSRWFSRGSKQRNRTKDMSNVSDSKSPDSDLVGFQAVTTQSAQVLETQTVAEAALPFSASELQSTNSQDGVAPLSVEMPLKTQAMIDLELVNSDAWLREIERGQLEWDSQLAALQEKIISSKIIGDRFLLMMLSSYFDIDLNTDNEENFQSELLQRIESLFNLIDFKKIIEEKTRTRRNSYPRSIDYYAGEFIIHRWLYVQGVNNLIVMMDKNYEIVESNIDDLLHAEREHNPFSGGSGLSCWRGFTRKFAKDYLVGTTPQDFFPEPAPRYLRDYRADTIGVAGARLLWALLTAIKLLSRPSGRTTSEIGIAFEQELIKEISEAYPTAQIDTTPKTGDQGADVILVVEGIKFVIQAKKYTGVVGNAAVQEVFAAKEYYEADYAIVVTNSRYTQSANVLAGKIGVELTTAQNYLRKIQQLIV